MQLRLLVFLCLFLFACTKKDKWLTDENARIVFSESTINFDTVFTQIGTVTQYLKVFNFNNQPLQLESIGLSSAQSAFTININGKPGPVATNVRINANDSIYIFIQARIQPNDSTQPFLLRDSIRFRLNGNDQYCYLQAYGRNATYLTNQHLINDTTLTATRPLVVLSPIVVPQNKTLTIEPGATFYIHPTATFRIDGKLIAKGVSTDSLPVRFRGLRTDAPYKDFPGSWPGLFFVGTGSVLQHCIIENSRKGIVAQGPTNGNKQLQIDQCVFQNISEEAVLGINSQLEINNSLLVNSGQSFATSLGGQYRLEHCTLAGMGNNFVEHKLPAVALSNHAQQNNQPNPQPLQVNFINCIVWGDNGTVDNEISTDIKTGAPTQIVLQHCLLKLSGTNAQLGLQNCLLNQLPRFDSIDNGKRFYNFRLQSTSPAINKGQPTSQPADLDRNTRTVGILPDLGAYERQN